MEITKNGATPADGPLTGRELLVIGGNRYFGRRLVRELHAAGARVTVLSRGSTPPPPGVAQLLADRNDEAALRAALRDRRFDAVVDQVCYTPRQAAVAARVFGSRTTRYVLTSTVEVYAELGTPGGGPLPESAFDPAGQQVRPELPWDDDQFRGAHYGEGKRQAEAVLTAAAAGGAFELVTVRTAHVLGGADFTGRLAHYAERVAAGLPIRVHRAAQPASFVHETEIARFLAWAATAPGLSGPFNAASTGTLDVHQLTAAVAAQGDGAAPRFEQVAAGAEASPFSFDRCYAMATGRAEALGFAFSHTEEWLPTAIREALQEVRS